MPQSQISRHPIAARTTSIPWWVRVVVILGALLLAIGAAIALFNPVMLVSPHDEINSAVHIYAGYLAARNAALAIMLVALLFLGARQALSNMMVLTALIQLLDACIDIAEARWPLIPGVLLYAVLFLIGAAHLSGYPFWKIKSWISTP
jgi:hypothetical protein